MVYKFTIPGHPISKSNFRPRGRGGSRESKAREKQLFEYEDKIWDVVGQEMEKNGWKILEGPVQVLIVTFRENQQSDVSNIGKSVFDALEEVLYNNDKQVRLAAIFDGGLDKESPRIEILAAPLGKLEILQVGDLAYSVPKTVDNSLKMKRVAKKSLEFSKEVCPTCGLPQERKVVRWAGVRRVLKVCKNDHGFFVE